MCINKTIYHLVKLPSLQKLADIPMGYLVVFYILFGVLFVQFNCVSLIIILVDTLSQSLDTYIMATMFHVIDLLIL